MKNKETTLGAILTTFRTFKRVNINVVIEINLPDFSYTKCFSEEGFYYSESIVFPEWKFVAYSDERVTVEVLSVLWNEVHQRLKQTFSKIIEQEELVRKEQELNNRIGRELFITVESEVRDGKI